MPIPPYDEATWLTVLDGVEAIYREANEPMNTHATIHALRAMHSHYTGMSLTGAVAKHYAALRRQLGIAPPPPPSVMGRTGLVRLVNRAFTDDAGAWCALGASDFPLAWLVRHDALRGERNLRWLTGKGVEFVRAFADVNGPTWEDREIHAGSDTWEADILAAIDLAAACGARIAWTVFAGPFMAHPPDWYLEQSRRLARIVADEAAQTQYVEIRNEGTGPDDETMRTCAQIFRTICPEVPVALCGTPEPDLPRLYASRAATLATVHFDRAYGERGWRPVRQPWGYYDLAGMPLAHVNNEPIGIDSSVAAESDPVKLAAAAITTWLSGSAGYVLHTGAGIRAGGTADLARGRVANMWEQPTLEQTLGLIASARAILPPDLPNWSRQGHGWGGHPLRLETRVGDEVESGAFSGCNRCYAATSGMRAVVLVAGIRDRFKAYDRAGAPWTVYVPAGADWQVYATGARAFDIRESQAACALLVR